MKIPWLKKKQPVNGKARQNVTKPARTSGGWPMGKPLPCPQDWVVIIHPGAFTKLITWHEHSTGLELSGYILLSEPVNADPDQPKVFYVEDLLLMCSIEESTGGYTEIAPELQVQGKMEARRRGYRPAQLGWWHRHPVSGWSSIDVNTLRQRVHELEMNEVLQA